MNRDNKAFQADSDTALGNLEIFNGDNSVKVSCSTEGL